MSGKPRWAFNTKLGNTWEDLAVQLEIPDHEIRQFRQGREAQHIWTWLENRDRLHDLPDALVAVGRTDLASRFTGSGGGSSAPDEVSSAPVGPLTRRQATFAAAAGVVAAAVAAALLVWALNDTTGNADPPPDGDRRSPSGSPTTTNRQFEARVVDTWDVNSNTFVGVIAYSDPTESGRGTDAGRYQEKNTIWIRCQNPNGREITDAPWQNRPLSTRRWYRLTTPGPQWVPSMYVSFVNGPDEQAVPTCP
jgi:hypothetical protein